MPTKKMIERLARMLDEGLGYPPSQPGSWGWEANVRNVKASLKLIEAGVRDIEKLADAAHRGWSDAVFKVDDPVRYSKPDGPAKKESRLKLANTPYADLSEEMKEIDRKSARALLAAWDKIREEKKSVIECVRSKLPPKGSSELKGKGTFLKLRSKALKECKK